MDLALFDFDGTITTGDTFTPFLRFAIPAHRAVLAGVLISPALVAHGLGILSTPSTRPIVARAGFMGARAPAVRKLGQTYACEVLPNAVQPRAMERLQWHRQHGHTVVVVSAGLDVYLAPWCERHAILLICSELEERRGRLTGRYRYGDCSGPNKAVLIRRTLQLERFETIYAYGDSPEDREMLALASRPYYQWREIADREHTG
jgi:phosphatidylglycerophosphatase C